MDATQSIESSSVVKPFLWGRSEIASRVQCADAIASKGVSQQQCADAVGVSLTPSKLQALRVIHNYVIRRPDGATAAERFFGSKPRDLFEWLLEQLPMPVRPRHKRTIPKPV